MLIIIERVNKERTLMKVIQVGIGGMGNAWLNTVLASPDVQYAAFVEINPSIAAEQAERHKLDRGLIFPSLSEAVAAARAAFPSEALGVIDVTPPAFHQTISMTALEAGIPVLSEKPLGNTFEAALAIAQKASETGVLHMVAQNYRYSVPAQTLKRVLDEGELGAVGSVVVDFFKGPHFGGFREQMPYPLIIDMSIHHFDMLRFFLDDNPVSVYGRSWNPPWSWFKGDASAAVSLQFAGGVVAAYNGSWCSNGTETPWNGHWRFECERGSILLREDVVYVQRRGEAAVPVEAVEMPRVAQAYLLHEFYEAVTTGKRPATTAQDNVKSLAIVFDVVESFANGGVVKSRA
jgi:predicted dehydrogenase